MIEGVSGQQENDSCTSFEISLMDADTGSHIATSTNSTICQGSNILSDYSDYFSSLHSCKGADDRPLVADLSLGCMSNVFGSQFWPSQEIIDNVKAENVESLADTSRVSSNMHSSSTSGIPFQDNQFMSADGEFSSFFPGNASYLPSEDHAICVKGERDEMIAPYQNSPYSDYTEFNVGQEMKQLNSAFPSTGCHSYNLFRCEDKDTNMLSNMPHHYQEVIDGTACKFPGETANLNLQALNKYLPNAQALIASEKQFCSVKSEGEGKVNQCRSLDSHISNGSRELVRRDFLDKSPVEDDDPDVCIIEDISHPAPTSRSADLGNSRNISQYHAYSDSQPYMSRGTRLKTRDEQYILRVALQVSTFTYGVSITPCILLNSFPPFLVVVTPNCSLYDVIICSIFQERRK